MTQKGTEKLPGYTFLGAGIESMGWTVLDLSSLSINTHNAVANVPPDIGGQDIGLEGSSAARLTSTYGRSAVGARSTRCPLPEQHDGQPMA